MWHSCIRFFSLAFSACPLWVLRVIVVLDHTMEHAHVRTSPGRMIGALQMSVSLQQEQTQETNIYARSGTRTRDPSELAAAFLCLRPHGHRDLQLCE